MATFVTNRLASGVWINQSALTSIYDITAYPVQVNQRDYAWIKWADPTSVVNQGAEIRRGAHGGSAAVGAISGVIIFTPVTASMWAYITNTVLGGQVSCIATLGLFNRTTNTQQVYWVWLNNRLNSDNYTRAAGGTASLTIEWSAEQVAPA